MTGALVAVAGAYLLAGLPVGALVVAGRMSPLHRLPAREYARWWSWGALAVLTAAYLLRLA